MQRVKRSGPVLAAFLMAVSCVSILRADEVIFWNGVALDILKDTATHPPKVGRDLAIVQASVYDALNAIDRTHTPMYYQPSVNGPISRESTVASAAHRALVRLYPAYEGALNGLLATRLAEMSAGPARDNGVVLGRSVADNMLALRVPDGWDNNYIHEGGTEPGRWRPSPPGYQYGLAPHWGKVAPFAIPGTEGFLPGPPPALDSAEYAEAFERVKRLGAADSTARTPDQTQIAQFWSDLPGQTASPPGKWNLIAQRLAEQQHNTLYQNARMLALLNISLADAGIVCWEVKYVYDFWRPEDAIHLAGMDGNPATLADPTWTPLLPTPPFPEYWSGHSTFSGAAAEVLSLFFGTDDLPFETDAGFDVLPGVLRSFDSFSEAAMEAGLSRIYGGIHFDFSNLDGLAHGGMIGAYVFDHFARPIPAPGAGILVCAGVVCLLRWRRTRRI
jgi:hypothetical protein